MHSYCRLCVARRFSAPTLSSHIWFISGMGRRGSRRAGMRKAPPAPWRRTWRDALHTTQTEGSVRRPVGRRTSFRTGLQLGDGLAGHSEYLTWNLVVCARRKTPRRLSWSVTPSSTPAKCWSVVVRSKASSFHLRFRFNSAGRRLSWDVFPVQCA